MSKRDFYNVLGVSKTASDKEIKKAYKKLAMQYHPDKNPDDAAAEAKFKEIKEAYEVLTNKEKRQQYDQFGHAAFDKSGFGGQGHQGQGFGGFEDIFGGAFNQQSQGFGGGFGGFEDIFSQARSGRGQARPRKGQDIEFTLTVDFIDAVKGAEKVVELPLNGEQKKNQCQNPCGNQ